MLDLEHEVVILDNFSTGRRSNLEAVASEIDVHAGDVGCLDHVERAVAGCDAVFHEAALPSVPRSIAVPLSSHQANAPGRLNVLVAACDAGEPPVIFGGGQQSRDFTYVDNVVDANIGALESPAAPGRVYNIACHDSVTLNELAHQLRELMGVGTRPVHAAPRPGEVRHSLAAIDAAREDLGYAPQVSLREGLKRTIRAFELEPMEVSA